ncbi:MULTISPECIES: J domain-containing protein [Clostridium]|uniref:J domain-containing protein n=1 Tax=Clostridium cibarium TaxID=2762247 RepID=A0ABR8PTM8_9CLOT|nr:MULTISPECIES: J domain-containing protein [Clostridium]MBD7911498.1 J domain-containing protein [Clostridium cibarium]
MDPYKVLGVLPHSSEKEIKDAYTNILETYNLDNLENDSFKSFNEEKINEANEAYRIITNTMTCEEVRDLIERDEFVAAEAKLNMVSDFSSAEWNYLKGILLIKKGWIESGVNHIKNAVTLNPYNDEYAATINKLNEKIGNFKNSNTSSTQSQSGMSGLCGGNNNNSSNKGGLC